MEPAFEKLADRCAKIASFCLERRGARCFQNCAPEKLFRYVAHQVLCGACFTVWGKAGEVLSVAFAWPENEVALRHRAAEGKPQFRWLEPEPDGDSIFLAEVVGKREYISQIAEQVMAHWPDSPRKKLFTYRTRNGSLQLVQLNLDCLMRFACYELPKHS